MSDGTKRDTANRTPKRTDQSVATTSSSDQDIAGAKIVPQASFIVLPSKGNPTLRCQYIDKAEIADDPQFWENSDTVTFMASCQTGSPEGPETQVRFLRDATSLYFSVDVHETSGQHAEHDNSQQVWMGNNIEFIVSPSSRNRPFHDEYEFLFNSSGCVNQLHWDGIRDVNLAMRWQPEGFECHFSNEPRFTDDRYGWGFYGEIPFCAFRAEAPNSGDLWRLGLYRRHTTRDERNLMMAWSPTLTDPPEFHVPSRYGILRFE